MTTTTLKALADERIRELLARAGVTYVGPCVVQAPGAWTRVGPTWHVPGIGWLTIGPGADRWGTTQGLAELAVLPTARPTWHAVAVSITPTPSIVFPIAADALAADHMAEVLALTGEALAAAEEEADHAR